MKMFFVVFVLILVLLGLLVFLFYSTKTIEQKETFLNLYSIKPTYTPNASTIPLASVKTSPIQLDQPKEGGVVANPLLIKGKAPGFWFFEGQMDARLETASGDIIGNGILRAEGEWMTENLVPFSGEIPFQISEDQNLNLIIQKANPSGLPERDEQYEIPLQYLR